MKRLLFISRMACAAAIGVVCAVPAAELRQSEQNRRALVDENTIHEGVIAMVNDSRYELRNYSKEDDIYIETHFAAPAKHSAAVTRHRLGADETT